MAARFPSIRSASGQLVSSWYQNIAAFKYSIWTTISNSSRYDDQGNAAVGVVDSKFLAVGIFNVGNGGTTASYWNGTSWQSATSFPVNIRNNRCIGDSSLFISVGGENPNVTNVVYKITTPTGSWTSVTNYPISVGNGVACWGNLNNKYVYVGGYNGSTVVANVYSTTGSGAWTTETSYPVTVRSTKGTVWNNKAYVIGGYNGSNYISSVYSYTGSGSWVAETSTPIATGDYGVAATSTGIFALINTSPTATVYKFNGTTWTAMSKQPTNRVFTYLLPFETEVYTCPSNASMERISVGALS